MYIDEKFLNAMGSGVDENDTACMTGFYAWRDHIGPLPYTEAMNIAEKIFSDPSLVEPNLGRRFLLWAKDLATNPDALILGGDAVFLDEFEVNVNGVATYFNSFDKAIDDLNQRLQTIDVSKLIEINKVIRINDTMTLFKIPHTYISKCDEVSIFNPSTGKWNFFTDMILAKNFFDTVSKELNDSVKNGQATIRQKIYDNVDKLYAWKVIFPEEQGIPK